MALGAGPGGREWGGRGRFAEGGQTAALGRALRIEGDLGGVAAAAADAGRDH